MPILYFLTWGINAYVLVSPQALTTGITIVLFINLSVFYLLFKAQFNLAKNSVVNVLLIEGVISRKFKNSLLLWTPLIVIGALLGVIGFIVLSTIAIWLSAFVFLFSCSKDFNIISPGGLCEDNLEFKKQGRRNIFTDEDRKALFNPATGLPLVTGASDASGSSYEASNINNN